MYVVTGSTGQVGGAVMRALLAEGKPVRALLRDEAKAAAIGALGAEPFLASVEDASRLEIAFEGAEAVFIMTPPLLQAPDPRGEHAMALATIQHALQAAHVKKVVFLSSVGAQHAEGTGAILKLYDMEQALFGLPFDAASIRACYFMENLVPLLPHVKESGQLPVVIEPLDSEIPMVATRDIGALAARLLTEEWNGQRTIEFEGPKAYSMNEAAAVFTKVLGRPVEAMLVPREARKAMYEQFGIAPGASETMVEMADGFNSGLVAFAGGDGVEHMQGTTTLEEVLQHK